jgi:energy-converting hydrogenase Eha subunit A
MGTTALLRSLQSRFGGLLSTLRNGLAIMGLGSLIFLATQWIGLPVDQAAGRSTAFGAIRYDGSSVVSPGEETENHGHRAIASYLARRYKVAPDATEQLVGAAFEAGQQSEIDPLLILAVMAIESRFNPIAESVMGAKGLMQVIPKHHQDKFFEFGGEDAVLEPMTNIRVGARILKEYIRRTGSLEAGLQLYAGALSDISAQYAQKVMAEKERLRQALRRAEDRRAKATAA